MKVHQIFFKNSLRNFCYLIEFNSGDIYCIDPFNPSEVINFLGDKNLKCIINTHDHCDHHSGNNDLVTKYNCDIYAHQDAQVPCKTKGLVNQEIIYEYTEFENTWTLKALFTPGHTMTHLCILLEKNNSPYAIFTGDCFFNAGVGNCYNGGDPELLYQTIDKYFTNFPDNLLIYPGHEYLKRNLEFTLNLEPSNQIASQFLSRVQTIDSDHTFFINNLKTERDINTFLRLDNLEIIKNINLINPANKQVFLKLRELRNKW
jgi:hydroxyacylglutathione hydrolase